MGRYAVINKTTKKVVNVIEWDGVSQWAPPNDHFVMESDRASIDHIYDESNGNFINDLTNQKI